MKKIEYGKIYVQSKDLRFLDAQERTPDEVKKQINFNLINVNKPDEYFEFTDPAFIKYLKQSYFIIDYDRFDKMSYDEIAKKLNENTKNIEKLQKQIKKINRRLINPKLKKQEAKPLEEAGALLMYYQESMIGFVEEKFVNSKKK